MRYLALILIPASLGVFVSGCGGQQEAEEQLQPEDFGDLSRSKQTPNPKLRDELDRITEESGTPEQLCKTLVAEADNVAAGLLSLFEQHKIKSILEKSEKIFPPKKFEFNPILLQKAINLRKQYDSQRLKAREALGRPKCDFGIQFMAGFLAELKFIDVVWVCAYLEAFRAAEALSDGKPEEAIESLEFMLRLASCLGAEKQVDARLQAAYIRTKAFAVLKAVIREDSIRREHVERLYEMVHGHLKAWPNDAYAWIGDRASGLHAYEMIRAGYLLELLTDEEIEQFRKEGVLKELTAAAKRSIDHDQLYYMETMRKIINSCSKPYYAREDLFDAIDDHLQDKRNSPEFPVVAARLLLPGTRESHVIQAQDRANWEAWGVALALALRRPAPYQINPLTGKNYDHQTPLDDLIVVGNIGSGEDGDDPSITVRDFGGEED